MDDGSGEAWGARGAVGRGAPEARSEWHGVPSYLTLGTLLQ